MGLILNLQVLLTRLSKAGMQPEEVQEHGNCATGGIVRRTKDYQPGEEKMMGRHDGFLKITDESCERPWGRNCKGQF